MYKKKYVAPITEKYGIMLSSLMAGSPPSTEVDGGKGPSSDTDKDNGSDESDAKNFNAWSSWDE